MSKNGDQRAARKAEKKEKQRARFEAATEEFDIPISRTPRVPDLSHDDSDKVLWSFEHFDGIDWRKLENHDHVAFCEVAEKLRSYSARTWNDIKHDLDRDHPSEPRYITPQCCQ